MTLVCSGLACPAGERPLNVILMIGDGMGIGQVTAAHVKKGGLNIESMPVAGLCRTFSEDMLATDSAAGATALATGVRTKNGMVSMGPEGDRLKTVFEHAESKGKSTGLAVTCNVTHATPAAFVSHAASRKDSDTIAAQIASAGLEVLFGGGLEDFMSGRSAGDSGKEERRLIDILGDRMQVAVRDEEFAAIKDDSPAAALLAVDHPGKADERSVTLADMVRKALAVLARNQTGFVLMVEGSQIDWAAHRNDEADMIDEVVDFDNAAGVALEFARKNGRTLVVVTADHETGGFSLLDGSLAQREVSSVDFAVRVHSAEMVPVFAMGPGAEAFGGVMDNYGIGRKLIEYVLDEGSAGAGR